jgi:filamentous hemagglutinin family protein
MKRLVGLLLGLSSVALALPEGPNVQAGTVQSQTSGQVMTLQQLSDRAIINWNRFNIDPQELVRVLQPNQAAILLNRVVGQDPSHILGQLQANGNIWLLNPNGILFGPQSQVNVGGLLASTWQLRDQDFLAGRYHFTAPEGPQAALVNQGELRVSDQGYLVLAAPLISQEGLLVANLGRVAMIAGQQATLSLDGLIHYRLAPESGTPGPVLLDASMLSQVLRNVVAQGTMPEASIVQRQDGRIWLTHASGANLQSGQVNAESVVLDSTRGTLLNPGARLSGSDLRVLSQGTAITRAGSSLHAPNGFAEVSAARVSLAGQVQAQDFLIDPEFLHIVPGNSGTLDGEDPIFAGTSAGSNSTISVDYLESITQGFVYLEANNSLFVDNGASLSMQPGVGLTLATVFGNVTFENLNDRVETTGANLNISAGNNIQVGQLRSNGRDVSLNSSQGSISANVVADRLFVDTPGEVAVQTQVNDLFLFQGGNVTLTNSADLTIRSLDVAGNATLNASGDLFFDVAEASNQVAGTAVINATGSVILPDVFTALIADTIFVDAGQDIVAPVLPNSLGPIWIVPMWLSGPVAHFCRMWSSRPPTSPFSPPKATSTMPLIPIGLWSASLASRVWWPPTSPSIPLAPST